MKTADLVTFTEEILNVKLQFLCSIMAPKNGISVSPWQDNAFFTKEFENWNKTLYSEKDKPGAFEKHQHSQSYKTAVLHQFALLSKEYGKVSEMHNKIIGIEQNSNRQLLVTILENILFNISSYSVSRILQYICVH